MINFLKQIYRIFFPHHIKGTNNQIINGKKLKITIFGNNNTISIGENTIVNCNISIVGNNCEIKINNDSTFRSGSIIIEGNNCKYIQGNKTGIRDAKMVIQEDNSSITIGDNCMLSYKILLRTSDAHPIFNDKNERINHAKSIILHNHVWLAESVTILKGVTIGENSIIGFGSICTRSIGNNLIAAGTPARIVKENINWSNNL